jgi:hypothetical protein
VLLADREDGSIEAGSGSFERIGIEELGIPELSSFAFKYDILELCTAVKPYLFQRLFEKYGVEKLVYLDPDVLVTGSLAPLFELLDRHRIVLTPHLTGPIEDEHKPSELDILRTGAYNLGCIALRRSEPAQALLRWWSERCYDGCFVDIEAGHFVDQRWIDLVPGLFEGVHVLRDPGYNVAYWNLHERKVKWSDSPVVNGEPLRFFHFSGVTPGGLGPVSRYQDRVSLDTRAELRPLFQHYEGLLRENGLEEASECPYGYGRFDDGRPIPAFARRVYRRLAPDERRRFGDPFETGGEHSLASWLYAPADLTERRAVERAAEAKRRRRVWRMRWAPFRGRPRPFVNNLMQQIHAGEEEVRSRFPEIGGRDRARFIHWYLKNGGDWDDFAVMRRGDETKYLLLKRGVRPADPPEPDGDADKASHPREP